MFYRRSNALFVSNVICSSMLYRRSNALFPLPAPKKNLGFICGVQSTKIFPLCCWMVQISVFRHIPRRVNFSPNISMEPCLQTSQPAFDFCEMAVGL